MFDIDGTNSFPNPAEVANNCGDKVGDMLSSSKADVWSCDDAYLNLSGDSILVNDNGDFEFALEIECSVPNEELRRMTDDDAIILIMALFKINI